MSIHRQVSTEESSTDTPPPLVDNQGNFDAFEDYNCLLLFDTFYSQKNKAKILLCFSNYKKLLSPRTQV